MKFDIIVTTRMGVESIASHELKQLGYEDLKVENGSVTFKGDMIDICRANLWLRTVDRVKIKVAEFKAETFDELFDETYKIDWKRFIDRDGSFPIKGRAVKSTLHSVPQCQAIVKKSIVEKLKKQYNYGSGKIPESDIKFPIEISIQKNMATLYLDTSGDALHKRGYRVFQGESPIKENLAASLVYLSRWKKEFPLYDLFCGSGTIPIEAAMIGLNRAPGRKRSFICEKWSWMDEKAWEDARVEADDLEIRDAKITIYGRDIDREMIKFSIQNAKEIGVNRYINFKNVEMKNCKIEDKNFFMISNVPYGERMGEESEVAYIYKTLGRKFSSMENLKMFIITSHLDFQKLFGKQARKTRKLYNGNIKTFFYQYF